jgi:hypothetical protein
MYNLEEKSIAKIVGHVKIIDPDTGEEILNKRNAINYENMSISLAYLLGGTQSGLGQMFGISQMAFGNSGVVVDSLGTINYQPPNTGTTTGSLYNQTYSKLVANLASANPENNISVLHTAGTSYSDIVVTCTLGYSEPLDQDSTDLSTTFNGNYIFNEIGLLEPNIDSITQGATLTHIVFHPVQKSANRRIQVIYTIRISVGS